MKSEWVIREIRAEEAVEAKRMIYQVAAVLMESDRPFEEVAAQWDAWGAFADLDDVQANYNENDGVFLVALAGGQIVGTGGFQRYAEGVCELRRITLLPEVRGQGLGYAMMMELFHRAHEMGYRKACLWTDRFKLWRAVAFYHRLGFVDVPHEGADEAELWMEREIERLTGL